MPKTNNIKELRTICLKKNYNTQPVYARFVTHQISIRIVNLIKDSRFTPNQVTVFAYLLAVLACVCFALGNRICFFAGALLFELFYVFDAVDGQLARYKKLSSMTGAWFDFIGNYIVHPFMFLCIGFGAYRFTYNSAAIVFGACAGISTAILYALSDTKASVFLKNINALKNNIQKPDNEVLCSKNGKNIIKYIFSAFHRLCTHPPVMNVITVTAVVNLFTDFYIPYFIAGFYAAAITFLWLIKLYFIVRTKKIDMEFAEYNIS